MPKFKKEEAIKALQGMESDEVFVYTPEEQTTLLENFKNTSIDAFERNRIAEIYNDLDKDFFNATGIQKQKGPDSPKTYKFWPDVAKRLKEEADAAKAEAEKLKAGGSPELTKEIDALRKASIEKDNEWREKYTKLQCSMTQKDIENTLDMARRELKLIDMPRPVVDTFIENVKSKLSASGKMIEGQLIFMDANGNPRINKETFKPYTAEELMRVELDPIIDKTTESKGGGTEPRKVVGKDGKTEIIVSVPGNVRSKIELSEYLIKTAGLPLNTPDFNTAYDKYGKDLPLK